MKGIARTAIIAALSIAIAWGMSWLPEVGDNNASPVFQPNSNRPAMLTETNLVDALVGLPLKLRIAKADYRESVMSVDLFLPQGVIGERFVYHDLYELVSFAWKRTSNVDRVLVRVMVQIGEDRQQKELLLAMEAKRSQRSPEIAPAGETPAALREYLESRYHFTYTPDWKKHN